MLHTNIADNNQIYLLFNFETNLEAFSESARDAALAATVDGAIVEA